MLVDHTKLAERLVYQAVVCNLSLQCTGECLDEVCSSFIPVSKCAFAFFCEVGMTTMALVVAGSSLATVIMLKVLSGLVYWWV
jgi:hypothetical protein